MNNLIVAIAAGVGVAALIGGFRLGGRHQIARARYAGWRAAVRAVPIALSAFLSALGDLIAGWLLLIGVALVVGAILWKVYA